MKPILSALALVALGTVSVHAADLMVDPAPVYMPEPSSYDVYMQLLGGVELGTADVFNDGSDDFDNEFDVGPALAATLGVVIQDGLSVELDGLYTYRNNSDVDDSYNSSASIMGNVKYTVDLDTWSLYGAVGIGYIHYWDQFNGGDVGEFGGFGYQLIAGAGFDLTEDMTLIGEVRYQNTFAPAEYLTTDDPFTIDVPTVSLLAGVKIGF